MKNDEKVSLIDLLGMVDALPDPCGHPVPFHVLMVRDKRTNKPCYLTFDRVPVGMRFGWAYNGVVVTMTPQRYVTVEDRRNPQKLTTASDATFITLHMGIPPRQLLPNQRLGRHWGTVNAYRDASLKEANYCLRNVLNTVGHPGWIAMSGVATLYLKGGNFPQNHNREGWLKATQDGLAQAMDMNDKNFHWEAINCVKVLNKGEQESMEIILRKLD